MAWHYGPAPDGRSTLYVVGHGGREAIEIFDVDANGEAPVLTWRGCVLTPDGMEANSVAALADGSLLVTIPLLTDVPIAEAMMGVDTGGVFSWSPGDAAMVPVAGTQLPYANGIEVSADGREFYVASSGLFNVTAYSNTNPAEVLRRATEFGFVPDNLHMAADGRLITAGLDLHGTACGEFKRSLEFSLEEFAACPRPFTVVAVDPQTMQVEVVATGPANPKFSNITMAVEVNDELWIGSFASDRIAYRSKTDADPSRRLQRPTPPGDIQRCNDTLAASKVAIEFPGFHTAGLSTLAQRMQRVWLGSASSRRRSMASPHLKQSPYSPDSMRRSAPSTRASCCWRRRPVSSAICWACIASIRDSRPTRAWSRRFTRTWPLADNAGLTAGARHDHGQSQRRRQPRARRAARPRRRRRARHDARVQAAGQLRADHRHGRRRPLRAAPGAVDRRHLHGAVPGREPGRTGGFVPLDQCQRYLRWWQQGHLSSTGQCFDIGNATRAALERFEWSGEPFSGGTTERSAGNGSLMRLAPVVLFFRRDPALALQLAGESSRTTHALPVCVDACRYFAGLLLGALEGRDKAALLAPRFHPVAGTWAPGELHPEIEAVAAARSACASRPQSAAAATWCVRSRRRCGRLRARTTSRAPACGPPTSATMPTPRRPSAASWPERTTARKASPRPGAGASRGAL
jgi:hypothetical protein